MAPPTTGREERCEVDLDCAAPCRRRRRRSGGQPHPGARAVGAPADGGDAPPARATSRRFAVLRHRLLALDRTSVSRIGLAFFLCLYFTLTALVSLGMWQHERMLYFHEHGAGAYGNRLPRSSAPSLLCAAIVYPMAGLRADDAHGAAAATLAGALSHKPVHVGRVHLDRDARQISDGTAPAQPRASSSRRRVRARGGALILLLLLRAERIVGRDGAAADRRASVEILAQLG